MRIKQFYRELYKDLLDNEGNLPIDNYIKLEKYNSEGLKIQKYHKNIYDLIRQASDNSLYYNTFYSLATNNGNSKSNNDSIYKTCLAFDFDKKDNEELNTKEIVNRFRNIGLYYHAVIDSGNGFHVYIFIEPTKDITLVNKVSKHIAKMLHSDINFANQVLRVPNTYNIKQEAKMVNIVHLDSNIKRKSINQIANRYLMECNNSTVIDYEMKKGNIPKCIENLLKNGSVDGNKNSDLQKIVVGLRKSKHTLPQIKVIASEWNTLNNPQMKDLDYQVEYMYSNLKVADFKCADCCYLNECYHKILSTFEYNESDTLIKYSESMCKKSKRSKKGVSKMNGNQLLIIGLLKNHNDGMSREDLLNDLEYTNEKYNIHNVAMSDKTLRNTLKQLEDNKYIKVDTVDRKKYYTLVKERVQEDCTFSVNYGLIRECVKGFITTNELELYCYMRYLHNEANRKGLNPYKGNLFKIPQEDLAKHFNVSRERITQMIQALLKEGIISIWYRGKLENSPCWYNVYRLNY